MTAMSMSSRSERARRPKTACVASSARLESSSASTNRACASASNSRAQYDLAFATAWWTPQILARQQDVKHKAYFVQDYEALFNPMGDAYLMAENSYRLGLTPITIGRWLTQRLAKEHGCSPTWFEFCANKDIYRPLGVEREPAICFIHQPEKPRRCPQLGFRALSIVKKRRPDVKIYLYGTRKSADFPIEHEHLGLLSVEECNALYNRCSAGFCISASNPSRIPFEMMASGLPVVDLFRENNLYDMPDGGILLAEPTPQQLATALLLIIENDKRRESMSAFGVEFMRQRPLEAGYEQFVTAVDELLTGQTGGWRRRALALKTLYNRPARLPGKNAKVTATMSEEAERDISQRLAAQAELDAIERSRAWRMVQSLKRNPLYRGYARARWGRHWDRQPRSADPRQRLNSVRSSTSYKVIVRVKRTGLFGSKRPATTRD